jgi:hypothetical protein
MNTLDDKIWYINELHEFRATLNFSAGMSHLGRKEIPFAQQLMIRERLKKELFDQIYGTMPKHCGIIRRHLREIEKELRDKGETKLANRVRSSSALVDTLYDQMTPFEPEMSHIWPTISLDSEKS